jgi:hypothetical protein
MKNKTLKRLVLKCDCGFLGDPGHDKDKLVVSNFADGEFEINGIFLFDKSVKRLIKFLQQNDTKRTNN